MFWLIPSASLSTWSQLLVHLTHSIIILLINLMHNITPLLTHRMHNITPSLTYLAHNICLYSVYSSHYKNNNNTLQHSCIAGTEDHPFTCAPNAQYCTNICIPDIQYHTLTLFIQLTQYRFTHTPDKQYIHS